MSKSEKGASLFYYITTQDLDDWPREHERAEDVQKAMAALEPALHTSVAIDPHKLVGMRIRLLPARYMFYIQVRGLPAWVKPSSAGPPGTSQCMPGSLGRFSILSVLAAGKHIHRRLDCRLVELQGTVSFNIFSPDTSRYALETSKGGLSDDGVLHVRGNPVVAPMRQTTASSVLDIWFTCASISGMRTSCSCAHCRTCSGRSATWMWKWQQSDGTQSCSGTPWPSVLLAASWNAVAPSICRA